MKTQERNIKTGTKGKRKKKDRKKPKNARARPQSKGGGGGGTRENAQPKECTSEEEKIKRGGVSFLGRAVGGKVKAH